MSTQNDWERRRRWRLINATASEPANVLDSYTWDLAYAGDQATSSDWPALAGDITLAALSTPTLNIATTGLLAAGIGSARVDKAVRAGSSGGFRVDNSYEMFGGPYHLRMLVYLRHPSATAYLLNIYDYTTRQFRITMSTSNVLYFYAYFGGAASNLPADVSIDLDGWNLVDIVIDPTGGSGGVISARWYINGVEGSGVEGSAEIDMIYPSLDVMVLNSPTDASATNADLLFVGHRRLSSAGEFTLAQHQADVAALGL